MKELKKFFEQEAHYNLIAAVRRKLGEEFSKKITEYLTEKGIQLTFKSSVKAFKKVFKKCNTHKFVLINVNWGDYDIEVIGNGDTVMGVVYSLAIKEAHVLNSNDKYKKKTIAEYCAEYSNKPSGVKNAPMHTINPLSQPPPKPEITIDYDTNFISTPPYIIDIEFANPKKTTDPIDPIQRDDAKKVLMKNDYDNDERYGVYQTEEDKMRIINEAKKKMKKKKNETNGTSRTNGTSSDENLSVNPVQPVQQANTVQQVNPANQVVQQVQQSNTVQQANTVQQENQVVQPVQQANTVQQVVEQSTHWSDNQFSSIDVVQGLLERFFQTTHGMANRDKISKVMKVIAGIITHFDDALDINIRNKFAMRRKIDNFMAEIEKQYNLMIDIFAKLSEYAAKINDYHAHSAIFDLIVEIREKINKLSERARGCVRILEMQSKINELSEEYYIKYEPNNKDINLLDQYRKW